MAALLRSSAPALCARSERRAEPGARRAAPRASCSAAPSSAFAGARGPLRSAAAFGSVSILLPRRAGLARSQRHTVKVLAQELRTEQKVRVVLGPYKDGAIAATVPEPKVDQAEVDKLLQEKLAKTHEFVRINFTGTGAKLGHTVRINFEGKYADGPQAGQPVKGTKAVGYELELKERDDEPWSTFVREIVKKGMGQEESKTFDLTFPANYKATPLAGIKAKFTVTVKEIGEKRELPKDPRPAEEQRADIEAQVRAAAERKTNEALDAIIRKALLESSEADVEKVAASVTWAKFGEKSLQDFKWNVLQEEVARVEGIQFDAVLTFLRSQAKVTHT